MSHLSIFGINGEIMKFNNMRSYRSHGSGKFKSADFLKIGSNVIIEDHVLVFHPETIAIGDNVYIGHHTILKGYHKNKMIIGDHTWIGQFCFFHSAGNIRIGKAVGIGPGVKILTSFHEDENNEQPLINNDLIFKEVVIGDGCDIGIGSIILPGITIGQGSIIGAGSVLTKNVPEYCVYAGNPAKLLKKRV